MVQKVGCAEDVDVVPNVGARPVGRRIVEQNDWTSRSHNSRKPCVADVDGRGRGHEHVIAVEGQSSGRERREREVFDRQPRAWVDADDSRDPVVRGILVAQARDVDVRSVTVEPAVPRHDDVVAAVRTQLKRRDREPVGGQLVVRVAYSVDAPEVRPVEQDVVDVCGVRYLREGKAADGRGSQAGSVRHVDEQSVDRSGAFEHYPDAVCLTVETDGSRGASREHRGLTDESPNHIGTPDGARVWVCPNTNGRVGWAAPLPYVH